MISLAQLHSQLQEQLQPASGHHVARRTVTGVHISELVDPTPYLEGGELLLTTGIPISGSAENVRAYVGRLMDKGVAALGLGLGAGVDRVPRELHSACAAAGMELLMVPEGIPFMNISRAYWDLVAKAGRTDLVTSLGTQTALARAATLPDAISSVIKALAQALGGWAVYLPADGGEETMWPPETDAVLPQLRHETARLNLAGTHSAATYRIQDADVVEHPVLVGRRIVGFLAMGAGRTLAKTDRQLILTVCVLLALKAQQQQEIAAATTVLESAVAKLFVAGQVEAGRMLATDMDLAVPAGLVRLLILRAESTAGLDGDVPAGLEGLTSHHPWGGLAAAVRACRLRYSSAGLSYFILDDSHVTTAPPGPHPPSAEFAGRAAFTGGTVFSGSGALSGLVLLPGMAEVVGELIEMVRELADGQLATAAGNSLDPRVEAWVAALGSYSRADLKATLRSYLRHRGQWEGASRELGLHRNSLRHRMDIATKLVGVDFDDPDVAAQLWLALRRPR